MAQWKIRQTVDLAASGSAPTAWSEALMTDGDKNAHTWAVTVLDNGRAADLNGATAICYFNRADHTTVAVKGTITGNLVSVMLTQECYAIEGPLVSIFRLTNTTGMILTLSVLRFNVGKGPNNNAVIDPGGVVPNLETLLAQVASIEAILQAANTATENAQTAADRANAAADKLNWDFVVTDDDAGNVTLSGLVDVVDDNNGNVSIGPFVTTQS